MRRKLVAGNWKMHGSLQQNALLLDSIVANLAGLTCEIVVCPPYPYLGQVRGLVDGSVILLGGQSTSEHDGGAFTGEVSAPMLADLGCSHVLVGHSERRTFFGESDTLVAAKFEAVLRAGMTPVLCVGESLEERQAGVTEEVVARQVRAVIDRVGIMAIADSVLAYEPVWAIGTGMTASPMQAQVVHAAIRTLVAAGDASVAKGLRILYGGSVKPQNAKELFGQADIDGGLIGGAALVADDFLAICRAAN